MFDNSNFYGMPRQATLPPQPVNDDPAFKPSFGDNWDVPTTHALDIYSPYAVDASDCRLHLADEPSNASGILMPQPLYPRWPRTSDADSLQPTPPVQLLQEMAAAEENSSHIPSGSSYYSEIQDQPNMLQDQYLASTQVPMGQQGGSQHPFTFTAPQAPVYGGYTGGMGGKMYAAQPHAHRSTRADTVVYADAQAPVRLYSSYSDGPGQVPFIASQQPFTYAAPQTPSAHVTYTGDIGDSGQTFSGAPQPRPSAPHPCSPFQASLESTDYTEGHSSGWYAPVFALQAAVSPSRSSRPSFNAPATTFGAGSGEPLAQPSLTTFDKPCSNLSTTVSGAASTSAPTPSRSESNEGRPNKKRKAVKGDLNTEEGSSAKKPRTSGKRKDDESANAAEGGRDAGKMPRTRSETKEDKTGKKMGENSEEGEKNKKKSEFGPKGGRRWKRQSARAAWSTKPGKQGNLVFGEICYDLKE